MWGRIGEIKSVGDLGLLVIFVRYCATFVKVKIQTNKINDL
jgi:hypothetical protein